MTSREEIYMQNWVEQFRTNVVEHPLTSRGRVREALNGRWTWYTINVAFLWRETPQHNGRAEGVWLRRRDAEWERWPFRLIP